MSEISQSFRFDKPDWFITRRPTWERLLAPLQGQPIKVLEIGSYEGRSAVWIAQNLLAHDDAHLTCVDPCLEEADVTANLLHNLAACGDSVALRRELSVDALPSLCVTGRRYDFIYIDGSHEAPDVFFDAAMSFRLLKPGGLMCFDDYEWSPGHLDGTVHAPQLAINAFAACYAGRVELIHRDAQAWFRKKI